MLADSDSKRLLLGNNSFRVGRSSNAFANNALYFSTEHLQSTHDIRTVMCFSVVTL